MKYTIKGINTKPYPLINFFNFSVIILSSVQDLAKELHKNYFTPMISHNIRIISFIYLVFEQNSIIIGSDNDQAYKKSSCKNFNLKIYNNFKLYIQNVY